MEFVGDLHVHSRYSRATSAELDLEHLYIWAQRKGIRVVGTGDFTHPGWFAELEAKLVPAEPGLFRLRPELEDLLADAVPPACAAPVRFLLSTEVSNIYKRGERTRKVHNLVLLPSLETASALARALARIGNLASDGRPILGLDSRDLLEIVLETSARRGLLIPAHIWTPWFSALGSRSGFDSIAECYRDLEPEIIAVETGLSSDPAMNWRLSSLDRYALVSSSDAHSAQKLGREATLFDCELGFDAIVLALRTRRGLAGTLEFFPEEGKYHFDGHRNCGVRLAPEESRARGGRCPACGRPLTLGVMYRVEELADRPEGTRPERAAPFTSLCGLAEVLAEVQGVGASSVSVTRARDLLCARLGPELRILRELPEEELRQAGGPLFAEAVLRMRRGEVETEGGYDGEFGRVHLLRPEERRELAGQSALFASLPAPRRRRERSAAATAGHQPVARAPAEPAETPGTLDLFARLPAIPDPLAELEDAQRQAAGHRGSPVLIVAGPGTGKTHTLTRRIASRVLAGAAPAQVLAVTFTVKAAGEMRARLTALLGEARARPIRVSTFHALALAILDDARRLEGRPPLTVLGEAERTALLAELWPGAEARELARIDKALRAFVAGEETPEALSTRWASAQAERDAIELDALCPAAVERLRAEAGLLARWRDRCRVVCVDEYQDLNHAQYQLVLLLCPPEDPALDLCVIGDPDQAIYSFRGADPRYFLRFAEDYPGSARFALERSFRSSRVVLEAAAALIAHNRERLPTRTFSELPGAPRLSLLSAESAEAEAELVVARIERSLGGTNLLAASEEEPALSFSEVAVLFRTRAQADALRRAFERSGVPYRSSAGRTGTEELEPVLGFLRGALAGEAALPDEGAEARELLELRQVVETLAPRAALGRLCEALCRAEELPAAQLAADRLAALLYDLQGVGLERWAPGLLGLCATCAEPDALGGEAVSLLTLHAAKGLEFSSVTIVGCEEGLLPQLRADPDQVNLEEERRLFYVGMTRARRTLTLTWAARRGSGPRSPSRFLEELPAELLARESARPRRRRPQLTLFG